MLFNKIKKNNIGSFGYTLIELLAVIAIIGIMSTVAVASYNSTKQKTALDKAVGQLTLDLRRVQNMAMNTTVFNGSVPSGGFGVNLMASFGTYTLYADVNGDKQYDINDGIVAAKTLDFPILVSSVTDNRTSINFLPPNPDIYFDGMLASTLFDSNITITLKYGTAGPTKDIVINGLTGQISVN